MCRMPNRWLDTKKLLVGSPDTVGLVSERSESKRLTFTSWALSDTPETETLYGQSHQQLQMQCIM